jgi:hypothetical protein
MINSAAIIISLIILTFAIVVFVIGRRKMVLVTREHATIKIRHLNNKKDLPEWLQGKEIGIVKIKTTKSKDRFEEHNHIDYKYQIDIYTDHDDFESEYE